MAVPVDQARLLRAIVIAVVVLSLSTAAHVIGGGTLPAPAVILSLAALTLLAVAMVAKRQPRLPILGVILGGGQLAFHQALGVLSAPPGCAPMAAHPHHAAMACTPGAVQSPTPMLDGELGAAMLAAHVVATLATAIVITRGEEALRVTAAWLRPLLVMLVPATISPDVRIPALTSHRSTARKTFLLTRPLRGPPHACH